MSWGDYLDPHPSTGERVEVTTYKSASRGEIAIRDMHNAHLVNAYKSVLARCEAASQHEPDEELAEAHGVLEALRAELDRRNIDPNKPDKEVAS